MRSQKVMRENLNTSSVLNEIYPFWGEKKMKEEKTQGINTETKAKDSCSTTKKSNKTELLDLRAGYGQHTSPILLYTTFFRTKPLYAHTVYMTVNFPYFPVESCNTFLKDLA